MALFTGVQREVVARAFSGKKKPAVVRRRRRKTVRVPRPQPPTLNQVIQAQRDADALQLRAMQMASQFEMHLSKKRKPRQYRRRSRVAR